MERRNFLAVLGASLASLLVASTESEASRRHRRHRKVAKRAKRKFRIARKSRPMYAGRKLVDFASREKPGTIIINTSERALYRIMNGKQAMRYLVAVGKQGFTWSGIAQVGAKRENPTWTPPAEMIARVPAYAKWANGMPGGSPQNPLGPRAMYLFNTGGDTGFRIHGTIHPESIGTAASSGCIRMLNREVIELYAETRIGTKVIVT
jgi:lipoprotein-anchoring transpeptidase ErfK/SrfK